VHTGEGLGQGDGPSLSPFGPPKISPAFSKLKHGSHLTRSQQNNFLARNSKTEETSGVTHPAPRVQWEVSSVIEAGNLPGEGQSLSP